MKLYISDKQREKIEEYLFRICIWIDIIGGSFILFALLITFLL